MKYTLPFFLIINFGALWLGSLATGPGVMGEWYTNLNQAPWTPPGWFFGLAWTTIMICFSIYMAYAWNSIKNHKELSLIFGIQLVLNIVWNPIFFSFKMVGLALITISSLALLMMYFYKHYYKDMKKLSFLILPYILWLITATSLNAYILLKN